MRTVEVPYTAAIVEEKDRYIIAASERFASAHALIDADFDEHEANMQDIAGRYQGIAIRLALNEVKIGQKDDWDSLWRYLVMVWVRDYGAERAREAAGTTRDDMQAIIDAALAPDVEFNPNAVASDLLKAQGLSSFRADTIARTETHNAMMYASQEGASAQARASGLTLRKRWVPVLDERTRVNHASMASQPAIPMDQDFIVGGEAMARPGDPRGSAGNVIRCRCVLAYEVEE
jgi:hypothetical protein